MSAWLHLPLFGLGAVVAVGVENEKDGDNFLLLRFGLLWELEILWFRIVPNINFDWVDEDLSVVAGVSIGFGF